MKRKTLLALILLLLTVGLIALPVGQETVERVAANFAMERLGSNYRVENIVPLDSGYPQSYIYAVNLNPGAYILVAGDDASLPIIGYSVLHKWGDAEIPEQLRYMLGIWTEQLRAISTQRLSANDEITALWSRYNVGAGSFVPRNDYRDVSPLISSVWGQGTYYNALCPPNTPVGCVATAMAQIMKYWSFPVTGTGSHSYVHPTYGTQSADFGATTYNWSAMPNNVTSANSAVATLCYHAGVAVEMDYDPSGSGAYSFDVPAALINYFRYSNTTDYYEKSMYSAATWDNMMKAELDAARPIYYSGSSAGSGGHAFILDGYSGSNYHLNWGWNGSYNGYYTLSALNPGTDNFSSGQAAVIGIQPTATSLALSEGFEVASFPPNNWTATASSWVRTTTSVITGTGSAYYTGTTSANGKQLRTPKLSVNASSPALTFKAKRGSTNRAEQIKVGYSVNPTGPYTYLTTFTLTATATVYTQQVNALTPGNYYFVLETYSTNTNQAKAYYIDDVTGPFAATQASVNLSSWAAGDLAPGEQASSGNIFSLSNLGSGTLTVTSITNLSSSEFSTNFNTGVTLVYGQSYDFGFKYDPINYGTDNLSFQIVTNGGTLTISLSGSASYAQLSDGFETYADFSLSFAPWTQRDGDASATYGVNGVTYTNSGYTGSFIIFNPSATSPAVGQADAHTGLKYAACFAATTPPNNDWLISPQLTLSGSGTLKFWAKSYTADYGLERFKVLYSTTTNVYTSFTNYLAGSATAYVEAPTTWTQYIYTLPSTARYFAIQCVSNDAFFLMIDDVSVSDSSTPPTPSFGHVSGYVYAFGTTTPIPSALVTIGTKTAYTDANGFYQINNLLIGTHNAVCTAPGMFYFSSTASGIVVSTGQTTTQNFGLKWGELEANPTSVNISLYQGEITTQIIDLSNPGGTAATAYAGYIASASAPASRSGRLGMSPRKPSPDSRGTRIAPLNVDDSERVDGWFGYATLAQADYYTAATTERGNYFAIDDIGLMDGSVSLSQLRHYFYNPSASAWTSTTNKFTWKVYTVSSTGTVTLVHTSAEITLSTTTPTNTYLLSTYNIPSPVSIPAGYDFIVTVAPSSTTTGKPQSLASSVENYNGLVYDSTNGWQDLGMDLILDAYVTGNSWLDGSAFSGSIAPTESVQIPLYFNTVGISAGTKYANMYIYNDANYSAPSGSNRGDVMVIPISLNITIATSPIAVLDNNSWTSITDVGTPSNSGEIFRLRNVGPGNLTVSSATGLAGTPFSTSFYTGLILSQNQYYDFSFTFNPTSPGIYNATYTIVTNGGTKTITLKGYADYLYETFEGEVFPPDGWQAYDIDADTYNWMSYTATDAAHNGLKCAGSASYVNDSRDRREGSSRLVLYPDNWLVSPRLAISNGSILSYWIAAQDAAWPAENYSVKISTTNSSVASFTTTLFTETLSSAAWLNREIDLSTYAGQSVYIAFQHHACSDQFVLKLDDVLLPPLAAPLVYGNISGRISKSGSADYVQGAIVEIAGRSFTTLEDGNYTISAIVADTYELSVTAPGYINYTSNVIIPPNGTLTHNVALNYAQVFTPITVFSPILASGQTSSIQVTMSNTGTATLDYTTDSGIWGGDILPGANLNEDFEDLDINGWIGSVGAYSDIYTGYGYNSQRNWVFASNETTVEQYIITPKLRVTASDVISFMYKQYNASNESLEILVSTTDSNITSFSPFAVIGPLSDTNWASFSQSLAAYAGQDIYLCFNYPRIDGYQYGYFMLDDIQGPQMVIAPSEWLSCLPSTGSLAPGANTSLSLSIDASSLPAGYYTAQTWVFSNGLVSPYKLYINLTVEQIQNPDTPTNLVSELIPGGIALAWDEMNYANSYKIYVSATPEGPYSLLQSSSSAYIEISEAQLNAAGLTNCVFIKVSSDTEMRSSSPVAFSQKSARSNLVKLYPTGAKSMPLSLQP